MTSWHMCWPSVKATPKHGILREYLLLLVRSRGRIKKRSVQAHFPRCVCMHAR